jgi:hypothetical protein
MENKKLKYGLIVVVIFVWGAIIFRVAGGMSAPDLPAATVRSQPVAAAPVRNTYVLFADYPDPFIPEEDSLDEIDIKKTGAGMGNAGPMAGGVMNAPKPEPPPPPTVQSFVQYIGMIANPEKKLKVAIISVHGKELLIREKEKKEDVLVRKIEMGKIGIVYKGKYVEIEKNQ